MVLKVIKAVAALLFALVATAGSLACILVWLGIKPTQVSHMTWPHWMWLIGTVILALSSVGTAGYSLKRMLELLTAERETRLRIQRLTADLEVARTDFSKSAEREDIQKRELEKLTGELDSVKTDLAAEQLLNTTAASPWLRSEGTESADAHADCIRIIPARHLKLEDYTRKNSSFSPYTDRVSVILTVEWDTELEVWSPVWESKEVAVKLPLGNCLEPPGPHGWREDDWSAGSFPCLTVAPTRAFRVSFDLRVVSGDGIAIRLRERKTGCLLFPIKIGGRFYYEKVEI
jgi:hypothetical protein